MKRLSCLFAALVAASPVYAQSCDGILAYMTEKYISDNRNTAYETFQHSLCSMSYEEFRRNYAVDGEAEAWDFFSGSQSFNANNYRQKRDDLCKETSKDEASSALSYVMYQGASQEVAETWAQCVQGPQFYCYAHPVAGSTQSNYVIVSKNPYADAEVIQTTLSNGKSTWTAEPGALVPNGFEISGRIIVAAERYDSTQSQNVTVNVQLGNAQDSCMAVTPAIYIPPPPPQGVETSFGGAWFASADGTCLRPNPFSGDCSCPSGFVGDVVTGGPFAARFGFCVAPTLDRLIDFGGVAYQHGQDCIVPNPFTGNCTACPGDMARLDVSAHWQDGDPVGGFPGGIQVCHAPELQDTRFGGLMYSYETCRTGNPWLDGSNEPQRNRDRWGRRYGCPEGYRQIDYTGLDDHNFPGGLSICVKI